MDKRFNEDELFDIKPDDITRWMKLRLFGSADVGGSNADIIQQKEINKATLRPTEGPFDDTYQYDRHSITKLSLLIATYLEDKPDVIDPNRIYNCIKRCYDDYVKGWNDNPQGYPLDTRMLLATAVASNWFTVKQFANMNQWLRDQDWY